MANAVYAVLDAVCGEVQALVFDTTTSNSGCNKGLLLLLFSLFKLGHKIHMKNIKKIKVNNLTSD